MPVNGGAGAAGGNTEQGPLRPTCLSDLKLVVALEGDVRVNVDLDRLEHRQLPDWHGQGA